MATHCPENGKRKSGSTGEPGSTGAGGTLATKWAVVGAVINFVRLVLEAFRA